ncbi:LLM class F420-dependent oxidoreductase [Flindersiella endophytica]
MKFSLYLPMGFGQELASFGDPIEAYEVLTELARTADEVGFETVWVLDHLHTVPPSQAYLFECWSTVAALARDTTRVRIGQLVTANAYRNPALQAKMASTIDVLSHGRFTFGIGAGWYEPEYTAYGYEYHSAPDRLRQLREALQIIQSMWTRDETTFEGRHYRVHGAINQPKGVQRPHIPILIAGGGEKVTLKLVAEYGDACNLIESPTGLQSKFGVLEQHCEAVGRPFQSIRRTATTVCILAESDEKAQERLPAGDRAMYPDDPGLYALLGTPETVRKRIAAYEAAGVQELILNFCGSTNPEDVRTFAVTFMN